MIVSLGSEFAAFDDSIPWLAAREAPARRRDGGRRSRAGNLLRRTAAGARARWQVVSRRAARRSAGCRFGRTDPDLVPEGPWFQWHFDTLHAPAGGGAASPTARSARRPIRVGRSLGVQFHPEVTPEIMDLWVAAYPATSSTRRGSTPSSCSRRPTSAPTAAAPTAWRLFDGFLNRIARDAAEAGPWRLTSGAVARRASGDRGHYGSSRSTSFARTNTWPSRSAVTSRYG